MTLAEAGQIMVGLYGMIVVVCGFLVSTEEIRSERFVSCGGRGCGAEYGATRDRLLSR